jgi:hypothetical protein
MRNKAGYRIIFNEDPKESGIFEINGGKICKSKTLFYQDNADLFAKIWEDVLK